MDILSDVFIKILNMSITASYVIAAVFLLRMLLRRLPKKYSYLLWGIVGLRLLCPFSISSAFSLFNLKLFGTVAAGEQQGLAYIPQNIGLQEVPQINTGVEVINRVLNGSLPAAEPMASVNPMQMLVYLGACIWVLGIIALLLYMLVSYLKLLRTVRYAVLLSGENEANAAKVYECDTIKTPFVIGILKPRIYIPFHLEEKERAYVLAHENYHIRRKDTLVKAAAFLLAAVYWFHPLVWLSYFFMAKDMEMSCDESVLKSMGNEIKQDYSRSLLSFAMNKRLHFPGPLAFGENFAGTRVKNVLYYRKPAVWVSIIAVLLAAGLSVVCLTDRKNGESENYLRLEKKETEEMFERATALEYFFTPEINSYLVYAEVYEGENYLGQVLVAAADLDDENRKIFMEKDEARIVAAGYTGEERSDRLVAEKGASILVYMVISEKDSEALQQAYPEVSPQSKASEYGEFFEPADGNYMMLLQAQLAENGRKGNT